MGMYTFYILKRSKTNLNGEVTSIRIVEIDCINMSNVKDLFKVIAETFQFPKYFGKNWHALEECLSDLNWLSHSGVILNMLNVNQLWCNNQTVDGNLVEVWLSVQKNGILKRYHSV